MGEYNKQNSEKKDKVKKEEQKDEIMKEQGNKVGAEREESIEGIAPDQKEGHDAKLSTPSVTQNSVKISTQTNHLSTIEVVEKRRLTKQRERRKKENKCFFLSSREKKSNTTDSSSLRRIRSRKKKRERTRRNRKCAQRTKEE